MKENEDDKANINHASRKINEPQQIDNNQLTTIDQQQENEAIEDNENVTYFLLDIQDSPSNIEENDNISNNKHDDQSNIKKKKSGKRSSSVSSQNSTTSSGSSVSAQVVIDHGTHHRAHSLLPHQIEKHTKKHLFRSTGDDESESDYYTYSLSRATSPHQRLDYSIQYHKPSCSQHIEDSQLSSPHPSEEEEEEEDNRGNKNALTNNKNGIYSENTDIHHESLTFNMDETSDQLEYNDDENAMIADDESERPICDEYNEQKTSKKIKKRRKKHQTLENSTSLSPKDHQNHHHQQKHNGPRKLNKRAQRVLQADLHSHTWSRRESEEHQQNHNHQVNPYVGLSSEEALSKLLLVANQILDEERQKIKKKIEIKDWLVRPDTVASILCAFSYLAFYLVGYFKSDPYQFRVTGALVETILLVLMILWNGFLYKRELRLTLNELTNRASTIIAALERSGMNMVQDIKIPLIPSMSVAKVVRDGVVRTFPVNLIVEGDIIEMVYGDVAPGRMKYLYHHTSTNKTTKNKDMDNSQIYSSSIDNDELNKMNSSETNEHLYHREYYLAEDQTFKPSFFGVPPPSGLMDEYLYSRGRHQFTLLETPLEDNMRTALTQTRPKTILWNELQVLSRTLYLKTLWIVLVISIIVNALGFGLQAISIHHVGLEQLAEHVFHLPFLAILPMLPLCLPTLWLIARNLGNAQLLILFEALQISKTEYEDDEVDEFDEEAPPPTKDLELSPNAVWDRFISLLSEWDRLSLTRSTNLLESLGSTTVICCLDREGTISNPFPTVEQIMFPNNEEDTIYLDLEEDSDDPYGYSFEDEDWENYLPQLKPVGLNFMLNTNCGVLQGRKRKSEYHRRRTKLQSYGRTDAARESCLCRLGKRIGFREEALQSFVLRSEIYTFAPYHDILSTPRFQFNQYYEFEVPNALSSVFEEKASGSYQLLTDGHPALVLDKCSDYWDGSTLQTMSSKMEKKIFDFYQNAVIHDMQCIAYAYRPINTSNGKKISFLNPSDDDNVDPGCAFVVIPYKPPSNGSSSSSSSSSSSNSGNSSTSSISDEEDDGEEEGLNSDISNKKISNEKRIGNSNSNMNNSTTVTIKTDSNNHISISNDSVSTSTTNDPDHTDYSFEDDEPVDSEEEETFYKEIVKGQIFLGMATMCHQPKQNVVDFIEDLGLAGIRFVYFSPTAERESKAFAERLGLETDWNSCILLSNPDDEHCGNGYIQTHDIKAQLPRGIDQIRPHLENVDDIPLHVSLFAECTPRANKEMIRIFQENGEVVCCLGNALNTKNTESFALADISIAMEPMHTKAQNRGRLTFNAQRQPPLAVGASLISLPCGLFMQYETSLYALTQLIRDARRLLLCIRMGFVFYMGGCLTITLTQLVSFCLVLPPILTGYQILWLLWIILPIMTLSMLFTPHDDNIMLLMPGKNIEHLADAKRFFVYFFLRFILVLVICLIIFVMTLVYSLQINTSQVFGYFGGDEGWLHWTKEQQWGILYAQNFMLIVFVWCITWISASFLHRTNSLREFIPFRNKVWIGAFILTVILQFCFCAVSLTKSPLSLSSIPWYVYFLGLIWPIIVVPVQELVKLHDEKEFTRFQKRSKLEFSTKLGMHSPL